MIGLSSLTSQMSYLIVPFKKIKKVESIILMGRGGGLQTRFREWQNFYKLKLEEAKKYSQWLFKTYFLAKILELTICEDLWTFSKYDYE